MEITKEDIVFEVARRTIHNLDRVAELGLGQDEADPRVYEVTHLMNSLLGLIVLPEELWLDCQTDDRLELLYAQGWPRPKFDNNDAGCKTFKKLVELLRHSIAHGNIDFNPADYKTGVRISHVQLWNHLDGNKKKAINFKVTLAVEELELLARKLAARILVSRKRMPPQPIIELKQERVA